MKRSEVKQLSKKHAILDYYFQEGMKSRDISKKLKVPVDMVYRTVEYFRRDS